MKTKSILHSDPFNVIITGVGGQGNVLASRVLGNMALAKGLSITIGETFGASQRGGSVMSHLRLSKKSSVSPLIPKGKAHVVVALEPTEGIRILKEYGNPQVSIVTNTRPIHSLGVICGDQQYPSPEKMRQWIESLSKQAWLVNTTDAAMTLGNPIYGNIMMLGIVVGAGLLPLDRDDFQKALDRLMPASKIEKNLKAFDIGAGMAAGNC